MLSNLVPCSVSCSSGEPESRSTLKLSTPLVLSTCGDVTWMVVSASGELPHFPSPREKPVPFGRSFQSLTVRGMKELLYLRVWPWLVDRYGSSPFEASLFVARVRPVYDGL
jgi:hypothetical protein